ncbi:MAG: hypothetical protein AVDCRST_MAG54-686, partial [uncultured Actinomycetospora sp.]
EVGPPVLPLLRRAGPAPPGGPGGRVGVRRLPQHVRRDRGTGAGERIRM